MIANRIRTDAYARALRQVISPGSVVLDIGTGTGIFALLSCRFGARRVYALEPGDAIEVAREVAAANGMADRIEFIQKMSTEVTLPEPVDVVVSDIHGRLPVSQGSIVSILDARRRLLRAGGFLIPRSDTMWAAVVEDPDLWDLSDPWECNGYGFNMRAGLPIVTNSLRSAKVRGDQLLTEPQCWATLDYATLGDPHVDGKVAWVVERAGTGHGLVLWFDSLLAPGVGFSNAPDEPELIYGRVFFPWSKPVPVAAGDSVSVALRANLVGGQYIWRWDTCVLGPGDRAQVKASFCQSTFWGDPLSPTQLRKRAPEYMPTLSEHGEIDSFILLRMDGRTSLEKIATRVSDRFPGRFPTWQNALDRVGRLSRKYSA